MNLFILSECPREAAEYHCDKHCVKMILETCQILSTNFQLQGIKAPYKETHKNHPSTKWSRESKANFEWTTRLLSALLLEYTKRYGKTHKGQEVYCWILDNKQLLNFEKEALTPFAVAISPDKLCRQVEGFEEMSVVDKYREYYKKDKAHFCTWKTQTPYWFEKSGLKVDMDWF